MNASDAIVTSASHSRPVICNLLPHTTLPGPMIKLPVSRKFLLPALAGALLALIAAQDASAQQGSSSSQAAQGYPDGAYGPVVPRRPGGFSRLTLSDIWGPAKMPPAPMDFGPHFDFPPEPLNGAPLHDPYPN